MKPSLLLRSSLGHESVSLERLTNGQNQSRGNCASGTSEEGIPPSSKNARRSGRTSNALLLRCGAAQAKRSGAPLIRGLTKSGSSSYLLGEISPFRIELINQLEFPGSPPLLQSTFARPRFNDGRVFFKINKPDDAILFRKSGGRFPLMFE